MVGVVCLFSTAPTWMFATIAALLFQTVLGIAISINIYKMEEGMIFSIVVAMLYIIDHIIVCMYSLRF